jgi:TRAP-type mannitol/chloroaromatic compound transport system substrate-binding protein
MKRRNVIKNISLAGVSTASVISSKNRVFAQNNNTDTNPSIEWRMATSWPESLDLVLDVINNFCSRVSQLTNERFKITPFTSGGIAPPLEVLDVVSTGTVECGHTAAYYYVNKNTALAFATVVPFGLTPYQHFSWIRHGGGLEITRNLYADFNVINILMINTGIQMGGWFKKKINTLADLKGLKMRMPGLGGLVLKSLGVETENLPPNQILPALESGKIDAAEWNHPYDDQRLGLNKVAPYCYYPGWHEPGANYELLINKNSYEKLPLSYQQALETAAMEAHLISLAKYDSANQIALQELIQSGTEFLPFSQELLSIFKKATFELYDQQAAENPSFKEVYTQWKQFREQIFQWNKINELSLDNFLASTLTN